MDVVRRDERQSQLGGQGDEARVGLLLLGQAVVLELDIEIALGEHRGVLDRGLLGLLRAVPNEPGGQLALDAAREPDQTFGIGGQQFLVYPRAIVKSLEIALGYQPAQALIALLVLDQEDEMGIMELLVRPGLLFEAAPGRNIDLAAEDGFDALGLGLLEELDRPEDVAVVGHGHGRHVLLVSQVYEVPDLDAAVKNAVFGMDVQMYERRCHGPINSRSTTITSGTWDHSHSIVPGGLLVTS